MKSEISNWRTEFDWMVDPRSGRPSETTAAAVAVEGTLDLAKVLAYLHFGEKVPPDVVLRVYDRIVEEVQHSAPSEIDRNAQHD